jgi:mono/diheme cytochrome c family protein
MPAWGASLNEKQIRDLVAYIRTLAVPPYKP